MADRYNLEKAASWTCHFFALSFASLLNPFATQADLGVAYLLWGGMSFSLRQHKLQTNSWFVNWFTLEKEDALIGMEARDPRCSLLIHKATWQVTVRHHRLQGDLPERRGQRKALEYQCYILSQCGPISCLLEVLMNCILLANDSPDNALFIGRFNQHWSEPWKVAISPEHVLCCGYFPFGLYFIGSSTTVVWQILSILAMIKPAHKAVCRFCEDTTLFSMRDVRVCMMWTASLEPTPMGLEKWLVIC